MRLGKRAVAGTILATTLLVTGAGVSGASAAITEPHSKACLDLGQKYYTYMGTTRLIPSTVVAYGSRGACVYYAQELLMSHGFSLAVDGIFGSQTKAAVIRFQTGVLVADGIVGNNTWSQLMIIN
jgi:peptidoglycan hydrolase-like protein with peptidoglycan-binding domain